LALVKSYGYRNSSLYTGITLVYKFRQRSDLWEGSGANADKWTRFAAGNRLAAPRGVPV